MSQVEILVLAFHSIWSWWNLETSRAASASLYFGVQFNKLVVQFSFVFGF